MAAQRDVIVRIKADYRAFQADMKAAARSAKQASEEIEKSGKKSSSSLGQLLIDAKQHDEAWGKAGGAMLGFGAALVGMVGVSVAKYAAFDKAMSRVQAATHESAGNMELLREAAIKAGADTAFSAEEAAAGIEELAKAGVSTGDILNGGLNGALSLAAAGELAVADAAEIAASALTQFKLSGDQIPHLADLLAAGAGKAQGSVADLGAALNQSGLVAASTGLSIEETSGALAAFASAGLTGSDAGTSFKTMLQSLNPNSKAASDLMDDLGIHAYDAEGAFIGMSEYAGVLQGALKDMSAEQRNATMKTLFGSDAVRAANILYEQGAEGIRNWEDSVNAAGYAAQTAAIMQDNLAGDVEKLGGAFDTVFIKAGGGVNDVLRNLTQSAEGIVDAFGRISPEALSTTASIAGIVGVAALAAGGFMTLAPKAIETWTAFRSLGTEGGKIPGKLGKIAKGAAIAGAALAALQIAGEIFSTKEVTTTTDYAEAIQKLVKAGAQAGSSDLDGIFQKWELSKGAESDAESVNSLSKAIGTLADPSTGQKVKNFLNPITSFLGSTPDEITQVEGKFEGLGSTLGDLVKAGDMEGTAATFRKVSEEFERNGLSAQDAMDAMPGYRDALKDVALAQGVVASDGELMVWAMDGIAPAAVTAAQNANAVSDGLAEMGVSADGAVESLDKLLDALLASGLATMSSKEMAFQWADSLRDTKGEIEEILATQSKLGPALAKGGQDFNDSTDSGVAALQLFHDKIREGSAVAEQFATDSSKSQADVQAQLESTYNAGVKTAEGFGMSTEAAIALTREALGIPTNVDIKTWIDSAAETGAQEIKDAVEGIPKMTNVKVIATDDGTVAVTQEQIASIRGRTVSTQVTDDGTILTVQGGINNIEGTTEQILVNDNGTVTVVQSKINSVTGKQEFIRVTDGGTVAGVQAKINNIADGYAQVRVTTIHSTEHISTGPGGRGGMTKALGGRIPKHSGGGKLPYTGLGTDKILGINSEGVPVSWVDDGEWVVNERSSNKHHRLLDAINRDDPQLKGFAGMMGLANGGRVGAAESRVKSTRRAYDLIDGKEANRLKKLAAKDQWEAAKDELASIKKSDKASEAAAKKSEDARKKAAEEEKARQGRLSDSRRELGTDLRRGEITDAFTSGSGLSQVDKLYEASRNKDYSLGKRKAALRDANALEKALGALTSKSDKLKTALEAAKEQADELRSVSDSISGGLRGEFSLGNYLKSEGQTFQPLTARGIIGNATGKANQIAGFGRKLDRLRGKGYSSAIIQEIAELGTAEGGRVADALLKGSASEVGQLNKQYSRLDYWSNQGGESVTKSMYKGGVDAAMGVVSGLESKTKDVENAFYKLGKNAEKSFKRSLGIKSPSKNAMGWMSDVVDGSVIGVDQNTPKLESAMLGLGKAGEDAFKMQPAISIPQSAEVARYAAQPTAHNGRNFTDGDMVALAQAMSNVQVQANLRIGNKEIAQANMAGRTELRLPK